METGAMRIGASRVDFFSIITGSAQQTWQPAMSTDTTVASYWLNWRFFLCSIFVLSTMVLAAFLILKYEGTKRRRRREDQNEPPGILYEDESWNTCFKGMHPVWLLAFRVFGFIVLSGLLAGNVINDGGGIFFFYTQWTFTLVTVYFGVAASLSIYGCCLKKAGSDGESCVTADAEQCIYRPPSIDGEFPEVFKSSYIDESSYIGTQGSYRRVANLWGYMLQILFQTCAGAVLLTDGVFWFIIYPFLSAKDFKLDFFNLVMHSVNAVFLLGDTALNSLRFPVFRIAYFVLWTALFVVFQWIIHACVSLWWPYPFLDLSSPYAPLWYAAVGMMHVPSYGVFALIIKLKNVWLTRQQQTLCLE